MLTIRDEKFHALNACGMPQHILTDCFGGTRLVLRDCAVCIYYWNASDAGNVVAVGSKNIKQNSISFFIIFVSSKSIVNSRSNASCICKLLGDI